MFFRETSSKKISKPFDFHFYTSVTTFLCMMVPGKGRRLVCFSLLLHGMGSLTPASHPPQACLVAGKKPAQKCFMFRGRSVPDTKARLQAAAALPSVSHPHDHIFLSPLASCHPAGIPSFRQDGSPVPGTLGIPKDHPALLWGVESPKREAGLRAMWSLS